MAVVPHPKKFFWGFKEILRNLVEMPCLIGVGVVQKILLGFGGSRNIPFGEKYILLNSLDRKIHHINSLFLGF